MKSIFTNIKLTAIVAMGFFTTTTSAQNMYQNTVSLGIKGGIQWNNYSVFALQSDNRMTAFNAGLTGVFSSNEHWAIGSDLLYSRNGGTYYAFAADNHIVRRSINTDYIRLNPKVSYFFGKVENKFRPKVTLGPSLGILVSANNNSGKSYKDDFKTLDFGAALGVGFNYRIAPALWCTMDVEYMAGLTTVNKKAVNSPSDGLKNNSLMIDIGISIGLSKFDK